MFSPPLFPADMTSRFPQGHLEAEVINLGSMSFCFYVDLSVATCTNVPLAKFNLQGEPNSQLY